MHIGFLPSIIILLVYDKWTAPPFNYPNANRNSIFMHTVPAFLWLFLATF
jgi:predicted aminopeptidase